ncbi:MAG: metalloregulator ArsR/SmtB family transcription factor [Gemmatimonadetes bacterium]|nr:metalloregulator ArsR/SmtB family transcription factor [Gemmatimonadota bacterium]
MPHAQPTPRETVRVLAALSDENRFRIVELLASEHEELTCGAIGKALGISPSLLSHHLAILAEAGIVGRRKNGLWTMNVLERPVIAAQIEVLQRLARTNGKARASARAETEASEAQVAAGG